MLPIAIKERQLSTAHSKRWPADEHESHNSCWILALVILVSLQSSMVLANSILTENLRPGTGDWKLTKPATMGWPLDDRATFPEIEGFASTTSVTLGDELSLYIDARIPDSNPTYSVRIYRLGWYGGLGARSMSWQSQEELKDEAVLPSRKMPVPTPDPVTGLVECDWQKSYSFNIPSNWVSGVYLAKLSLIPSGFQSYILFVVREDARSSDFLFQSSVTTWQAYNPWGGRSLYSYPDAATEVSFRRPYSGPCFPFSNRLKGYGRSDLAYGSGAGEFFVQIGASPAPGWEYNCVRWLERQGYDVTYCTSVDTHATSGLIWPAKLVKGFLSVGHDEYWSEPMRRNVSQARDRGVNLEIGRAHV